MPDPVEVDSLTWFALSKADAPRALIARCAMAEKANSERQARAVLFGSLFENCKLSTFNAAGYDLVTSQAFTLVNTPIIRNTLRSIVMTLLSKLFCVDAPLPKAMSDGGDWNQRAKAEDVDQFLECEFQQQQGQFNNIDDLWNHGGMLAMAATGSCGVMVLPGWDQVECGLDDTLTWGLDNDGRWGATRGMVRTVWADPEELVFNLPRKFKADILASCETLNDPLEATRLGRGAHGQPKRAVRLCQGFRVAARGRDGRQMLVLKNGRVIEDKPYTRTEIPAVIWHWERQLAGDWGTPVTQTAFEEVMRQNERLADVDNMISNLMQVLLMGPKEIVDQMQLAKGITRVDSDFADKLRVEVMPRLDREGLEMMREHEIGVHNSVGVNQAQTAAKKASGTTSGVHEELVAHLFSERFADQQRRLTYAKVEATAKRFLWAAQDMVEMGRKDFIRQWKNKDGDTYRKLKVSDLDLDSSRYVFSVAAVSEDKNRPETRAKKADEYLRLNLLSGSEWLQTQKDLDPDANTALATEQYEWVESQIRKWTREPVETMGEVYQSPRKWLDPVQMGKQVSVALLKAQDAGCPEERMAFFDRFLDECTVLARDQAQEAAAVGAPLPGMTQPLQGGSPPNAGSQPIQ
jgi:hypothetical protein